jgi:hypothetical protein
MTDDHFSSLLSCYDPIGDQLVTLNTPYACLPCAGGIFRKLHGWDRTTVVGTLFEGGVLVQKGHRVPSTSGYCTVENSRKERPGRSRLTFKFGNC